MKMPEEALFDRVKRILKQIPGTQRLIRIRDKIVRIRELSSLIKENKIVIFPSYSRMGNEFTLTHEMVHEVVKEWLDLYGIVHLRRATAAAINSPVGAILLYDPQALLGIPHTHEEYLAQVGSKTRNMIRKAERQGYEFKEFVWNEHLGEIYEINTSKEIRQSLPMLWWYREPVQPRHHSKEELQYRKYYGGFKEGKLCAYLHFLVCGDFAVIKHIIGHAQHLTYGIMDGLISWTVQECIGNPQIRWFHYPGNGLKGSLGAFKKHAGFQEYAILLDLECDQDLLEYSEHKVKAWWRV
jgi:hypothetical protein